MISDTYREMQRELHETRPDYGMASLQFGRVVGNIIDGNAVDTVLDYGAGKQRLKTVIDASRPYKYAAYDPAVPGISAAPEPADLVCCIDVLEHVEPDMLLAVLGHLHKLTRRVVFVTVHCGPAGKTLSDGRNAHLIQERPAWWLLKLCQFFDPMYVEPTPGGFMLIGAPL